MICSPPPSPEISHPAPLALGRAKIVPRADAILLPYQTKWVSDTSRLKIAEKSRQIGWTWATACALVRRKGLFPAACDAWISSRKGRQGQISTI